MSTRPFRRTAAGVLTAIIILTALSAPAYAEDTGTIAGRYTDNGAPVAGASVNAQPEFGGFGGSATTDGNGEYRIEGLRPGRFRVSFAQFGQTGVSWSQYAFSKPEYSTATLITVTAGAVSTVDDSRVHGGTVSVSFDSPTFSTDIAFWPEFGSGGGYRQVTVFGTGQSTVQLFPGRYKVSFATNHNTDLSTGRYIQYAGGTDNRAEATIFDVVADGHITINEALLPVGRMEGRFTDAAGNGVPNVEVSISRPGLDRGPSAHTDANGYYRFPHMRASDRWRVAFLSFQQNLRQFAFGKVRERDADEITIAQGQTTVVSDSRLLTGTVKLTAKEAGTGIGVEKFQAIIEGGGYASTINGELVLQGVPVGTHPVDISAYGFESAQGAVTVTVRAGEQTEAAVEFRPTTRIEAIAVDATTGQPVEGVCLMRARPQRFELSSEQCFEETPSGASGRVMLQIYEPGWYQVLAFPMGSQGLGAQWVGSHGGTGSQLLAQLIKVEAGQSAKAPIIRLDRAGTITGQVTSPSGAPLPNVPVSLGDWSNAGPGAPGMYETDDQGRYTIDNLGPYRWPLRFQKSPDLGIQWSGQKGDRLLARPVTVRSGQTTVYDFRFRTPTQVTTHPAVNGSCLIQAFNLLTGDQSGGKWVEGDCSQPVTLPITGPQWVRMRVEYYENDEVKVRFYETRFVR